MTAPTRLPKIRLDERFNYVAAFLTFRCNYRCSYCINKHSGSIRMSRHLSSDEWIAGLNRLVLRDDLPLTLQGGEPTIHPEFYQIVNAVDPSTHIDLLTNLQFDPDAFSARIDPGRLRRNAPYASIRVSFHPQVMNLEATMKKILTLQNRGYSIGLFGVLHPDQEDVILAAREKCLAAGIDFRTKEFLGFHEGKLYGEYRYPGAIGAEKPASVLCRNTEMLIDPSGFVFRCHHDVYNGIDPIGHLLDPNFKVESKYRPCQFYGKCNPCDIKLKTNRFQQFGHCSVEIIGDPVDGSADLPDWHFQPAQENAAV